MLPPPPTPRPVSSTEIADAREIFKLRHQNPLFDIYGRNPFDTQPRVFRAGAGPHPAPTPTPPTPPTIPTPQATTMFK
ncbi:hypothetical protein K440DRAFT_620667 [Wilcoxina mikolae CBS 423.85]|nr:hypothetical protein K440DRAFT_620667 [Wilcoxina mikolae CBS 423.85]